METFDAQTECLYLPGDSLSVSVCEARRGLRGLEPDIETAVHRPSLPTTHQCLSLSPQQTATPTLEMETNFMYEKYEMSTLCPPL